KLKEFFKNKEIPKLTVKAETLIEKFNYKEGKELGSKLKEIEEFWIENSFKISDQELKRIIKS
ncbi:CCA tRNA nucleotidyltransferase, partial [Candidatus Pelagibacter sp.]|nr:CCA tRNA nucleotidyltransferase [Candidatus Pelagibacter sp.]